MAVPDAVVIARFLRHYPTEFRSPHYQTSDGVIPFGKFWILYAAMTHNHAHDRVNEMRAITNAIAIAFAKKGDSAARTLVREEMRSAFLSAGKQ